MNQPQSSVKTLAVTGALGFTIFVGPTAALAASPGPGDVIPTGHTSSTTTTSSECPREHEQAPKHHTTTNKRHTNKHREHAERRAPNEHQRGSTSNPIHIDSISAYIPVQTPNSESTATPNASSVNHGANAASVDPRGYEPSPWPTVILVILFSTTAVLALNGIVSAHDLAHAIKRR